MRKGLLKLTALLIVAVFTITVAYAADKKDYTLVIDDEVMSADVYEDNGTVMLPLRAICERLGFNVEWDNETRTVVLEKLPVYVTFNVDYIEDSTVVYRLYKNGILLFESNTKDISVESSLLVGENNYYVKVIKDVETKEEIIEDEELKKLED